MARGTLRFLRRGEPVTVSSFLPRTTLLDWLRLEAKATGTKEGCGEGDCGACTVVLGRERDGRLVYEPVNACILLLGQVDGCEVVTVEDLAGPRGLHPVQAAMVAHHGSQCGFCTPGIVMSLFALYQEGERPVAREAVVDALAGNLCRCTGYRPIVDAALDACAAPAADAFEARRDATRDALRRLDDGEDLFVGTDEAFFAAPASEDSLASLFLRHPDATLVAGATDVGLWITKAMMPLSRIIWLGRVKGLDALGETPASLSLGATVSHARAHEVLAKLDPDLGELMRRFGSTQVRVSGTVGGNVANGSPIGDLPPALIALGAEVELRRGGETRRLPLEDFFIAYRKQDRQPGEYVRRLIVPKLRPADHVRAFKVSKRMDEDISSVMLACRITVEQDVVTEARIAFGGMAGTPKRALEAERALIGNPAGDGSVWRASSEALARDFTPLDDHRASAGYRMQVAKNLIIKAMAEIGTGAPTSATRISGHREARHAAE
ncbi:MAG: xanthine dehydrogenase small subunit [Alsobacter sp.]